MPEHVTVYSSPLGSLTVHPLSAVRLTQSVTVTVNTKSAVSPVHTVLAAGAVGVTVGAVNAVTVASSSRSCGQLPSARCVLGTDPVSVYAPAARLLHATVNVFVSTKTAAHVVAPPLASVTWKLAPETCSAVKSCSCSALNVNSSPPLVLPGHVFVATGDPLSVSWSSFGTSTSTVRVVDFSQPVIRSSVG